MKLHNLSRFHNLNLFLADLQCGFLERLVYKNKNQHCRCSYFQHLMKGIAQRNARNRKKQKNPYILGTKLLVRKRDELVCNFINDAAKKGSDSKLLNAPKDPNIPHIDADIEDPQLYIFYGF
ncbi:hypothetical protein MTR_1g009830 [Medicago truncatula]|uniref:Uncharacterized protein n=1 Tax=Medicago truncatula TaxID=3880 RepID=A0A072VCK3_MEDTR|nr:hypothetical protein MTR_1g009830 [Medicago truncatula]